MARRAKTSLKLPTGERQRRLVGGRPSRGASSSKSRHIRGAHEAFVASLDFKTRGSQTPTPRHRPRPERAPFLSIAGLRDAPRRDALAMRARASLLRLRRRPLLSKTQGAGPRPFARPSRTNARARDSPPPHDGRVSNATADRCVYLTVAIGMNTHSTTP